MVTSLTNEKNGELPPIFGERSMTATHENYCLRPDEMFNGMHLKDIATSSANVLYGLPNVYYTGNHIAFLHSNLDISVKSIVTYSNPDSRVLEISKGSAVLIPVFTAQYHIGSYFKGSKIVSEVGARHAVREHISEGREMWAVSVSGTKSQRKFKPLVGDIRNYYLETNLFRLTVSEKNLFKDTLEIPIQPGNYYAVLGGYFILFRPLAPGSYGIWFGANGPGGQQSEGFYEIMVHNRESPYPKDLSFEKGGKK